MRVVEIDQNNNRIRLTPAQEKCRRPTTSAAARLIYRDHTCEMTYGVVRSHILRQTRLQQNCTDSDRTLLCKLALHGRFHEIEEPLFYKRRHAANQYLDWRKRMIWFKPGTQGELHSRP